MIFFCIIHEVYCWQLVWKSSLWHHRGCYMCYQWLSLRNNPVIILAVTSQWLLQVLPMTLPEKQSCHHPRCDITVVATCVTNDSPWETIRSSSSLWHHSVCYMCYQWLSLRNNQVIILAVTSQWLLHVLPMTLPEKQSGHHPRCDITVVATGVTNDSAWETIRSSSSLWHHSGCYMCYQWLSLKNNQVIILAVTSQWLLHVLPMTLPEKQSGHHPRCDITVVATGVTNDSPWETIRSSSSLWHHSGCYMCYQWLSLRNNQVIILAVTSQWLLHVSPMTLPEKQSGHHSRCDITVVATGVTNDSPWETIRSSSSLWHHSGCYMCYQWLSLRNNQVIILAVTSQWLLHVLPMTLPEKQSGHHPRCDITVVATCVTNDSPRETIRSSSSLWHHSGCYMCYQWLSLRNNQVIILAVTSQWLLQVLPMTLPEKQSGHYPRCDITVVATCVTNDTPWKTIRSSSSLWHHSGCYMCHQWLSPRNNPVIILAVTSQWLLQVLPMTLPEKQSGHHPRCDITVVATGVTNDSPWETIRSSSSLWHHSGCYRCYQWHFLKNNQVIILAVTSQWLLHVLPMTLPEKQSGHHPRCDITVVATCITNDSPWETIRSSSSLWHHSGCYMCYQWLSLRNNHVIILAVTSQWLLHVLPMTLPEKQSGHHPRCDITVVATCVTNDSPWETIRSSSSLWHHSGCYMCYQWLSLRNNQVIILAVTSQWLLHVLPMTLPEKQSCHQPRCDITVVATCVTNDSPWETIRSSSSLWHHSGCYMCYQWLSLRNNQVIILAVTSQWLLHVLPMTLPEKQSGHHPRCDITVVATCVTNDSPWETIRSSSSLWHHSGCYMCHQWLSPRNNQVIILAVTSQWLLHVLPMTLPEKQSGHHPRCDITVVATCVTNDSPWETIMSSSSLWHHSGCYMCYQWLSLRNNQVIILAVTSQWLLHVLPMTLPEKQSGHHPRCDITVVATCVTNDSPWETIRSSSSLWHHSGCYMCYQWLSLRNNHVIILAVTSQWLLQV